VRPAEARWRETVVDLFAAAAAGLGAFYAEGWAEPGWNVASNNRLGDRYHEPVAAALAGAAAPRRRAKLPPLALPPDLVRPG
jgi:hypothetical protein